MKTGKMLICVLFASFVMFMLGGCGTPKPNVDLNGTWVNEKMSMQKEIDTADGWKQYIHTSDATPLYEGTAKLTGQWTDSEGNIWCKWLSTFAAPDAYKGQIFTVLEKYNKTATVRESVWASPSSDAELKNPVYPSKIDPQNPNYTIYYRAQK